MTGELGAIVGLLIPPSNNMIIYSAASRIGVSIGDLFLAGILPGVMTAALLMFVAWRVAVLRGYASGAFTGWRSFTRALLFAIPGLMTAIIIIGGILSGIFTATESSAIAVIYTIAIGALVYQTLGWKRFSEAAMQSVKTVSYTHLTLPTKRIV